MAYLFRLVVAALLLVGASLAMAVISPVFTWHGSTYNPGGSGSALLCGSEADPLAAIKCALTVEHNRPASDFDSCSLLSNSGTNASGQCRFIPNNNYLQQAATKNAVGTCPANSQSNGAGGCVCSSGYTDQAGVCVDSGAAECSALAGTSAGSKNFEGQGDSFSFCDGWNTAGGGKCIATVSGDMIRWESPPGSGHWVSQGQATYTGGKGTTCDGNGAAPGTPGDAPKPADGVPKVPPDPGTAAPSPCPSGQAPGEVNGQRVCAPVGPDVKAVDNKEVTNPDGSRTTERSSTSCTGGKCDTTKETCTTAAGGGTPSCTSGTTSQGQGAFCAANKGSKACTGDGDGSGGSFTGDCVAGFKADGDDPVLNAMALEVHKQNCKLTPKDEELVLANAERVKTGNQTLTNPNNSTVSLSSSSFDTSDALNAGSSCVSDKAITVFGGVVVVLPFSRACDAFPMLGTLLVALSFLAAAVIVMRG